MLSPEEPKGTRPSSSYTMDNADSQFTKSADPSVFEKPNVVEASAPSLSDNDNNDHKDSVPVEQEKAVEKAAATSDEEEIEYPSSWKLVLITIALCLSVFCMALVSTPRVCVLIRIASHPLIQSLT